MKIVGIDLSLTRTGLAAFCNGVMIVDVITSKPQKAAVDDLGRLREIRGSVIDWARHADLAVVEDPTQAGAGYKGATGKLSERGGLLWLVLDRLGSVGVPYAVVSPKGLKLFATGSGNASKERMMEAARITWPEAGIQGDDEADAAWLAAMGATRYGYEIHTVSERQATAVQKIIWPRAA